MALGAGEDVIGPSPVSVFGRMPAVLRCGMIDTEIRAVPNSGHPGEEVISMAKKAESPITGSKPQTPTTAKKPKREKAKQKKRK